MRVALIHDWLLAWRGGEKCLEQLALMYPEGEVFTIFVEPKLVKTKLPNRYIHASFLSSLPYVRYYYRFLFPLYPLAIFDLSRKLKNAHKKRGFDVAISVSHCVVKNIKPPMGLKHICYCLTPVRYLWDQYDNYFRGKWYEVIVRNIRSMFLRWDVSSSKGVSDFIAISDFVAKRIKNYYGRESSVVYPPVELDRFLSLKKAEYHEDFYLMVNALVPYKKVDLVVQAFNELGKKLIIIGDGPDKNKLLLLAKGNIKIMGWVDDSKLDSYFVTCRALIYLAVEDFGIAPVEAQAAGKPVICLRSGGCAETGVFEGDDITALEINAANPQAVSDAIIKFEALHEKGYFSPESCRKSALRFSTKKFRENFERVLN